MGPHTSLQRWRRFYTILLIYVSVSEHEIVCYIVVNAMTNVKVKGQAPPLWRKWGGPSPLPRFRRLCSCSCPAAGNVMLFLQAATAQSFYVQGCFAIDYDFATHRCYFFANNVLQIFAVTLTNSASTPSSSIVPFPFFLHCIIASGVLQPGSVGLRPNPTVVHITLCEWHCVLSDGLSLNSSTARWRA